MIVTNIIITTILLTLKWQNIKNLLRVYMIKETGTTVGTVIIRVKFDSSDGVL